MMNDCKQAHEISVAKCTHCGRVWDIETEFPPFGCPEDSTVVVLNVCRDVLITQKLMVGEC